MRVVRRLAWLVVGMMSGVAMGAGPRWVSGSPYFANNSGVPIGWYTNSPQYFTDPGNLSAYVTHAQADALVAAAAGTWNVSVSAMVVAQGGELAEHVSSGNVYMGVNGPVWPADVSAGNRAAIQIAVIYDSDGSVTDTLLGGGASAPGSCRQNAVTESVDGVSTAGTITHALLILNGRCTGSDPDAQLQMQYQLTRMFGRVLGLGWSQVNDNVFTGVPEATYVEEQNWPLMHPMDVYCGAYTYQCMPQAFALSNDDIGALATLYPSQVTAGGKIPSWSQAAGAWGTVGFGNGAGMDGVNVVVRRYHVQQNYIDPFEVSSSVSGYRTQRLGGNFVTPKGTGMAWSYGWPNAMHGYYYVSWIPFLTGDGSWDGMVLSTEAVNPLYVGQYGLGPYTGSPVHPSGAAMAGESTSTRNSAGFANLTASGGAGPCGSGGDGTETSPAAVGGGGWWTGTMCGYGHSAWSYVPVRAGRTMTIEVGAVDEEGLATTGKMLPVIGVWAGTDRTGTVPTVGAAGTPLNTTTVGMTAVTVASPGAGTLRIGLADERGDGRQDYGYKARVLYADSIAPATVPVNGGVVTITGMGFRAGNSVTVNGAQAVVESWTATTIVAVAPAVTGPVTANVVVTDLSTGGTSTMAGALSYGGTGPPDVISVVSAPANGSYVGSLAGTGFSVQVMLAGGVTPAGLTAVTVSAVGATFAGCGGSSACVLTTNAVGVVTTSVTPVTAGTVSLTATGGGASATAVFGAVAGLPDQLQVLSLPGGTVYAGVAAGTLFAVQVFLADGVTPAAGVGVTVTAGGATLGACGAASCVVTASALGVVSTTVTPLVAGVVSLTAAAGGGTLSASFGAVTMPPDVLRVISVPANGSYVGRVAAAAWQVQVLLGDGVTVVPGAAVTVTATGATLGACGAASCAMTADANGMVSTAVTPVQAGSVGLSAGSGVVWAVATFSAVVVPPNVFHLVSVPASGLYVGSTAAVPFAVELLLGDGVTPAAVAAVTVTATGGTLGACGAASCTLTTNAGGIISTAVTALVAGTVGVSASAGAVSIASTFTAVADRLKVVSVPDSKVYVGVPALTPLTVQVFLADGVTPAAGAAVTLTTLLATESACGASTCVLTADATGTVSTGLTPLLVGVATVTATAGGGTVGASFPVLAMGNDIVKFLSVPTGTVYETAIAATPLTIQVLLGDGLTLAPGAMVQLTSQRANLGSCGSGGSDIPYCGVRSLVAADASGQLTGWIQPIAAGLVTINATVNGVGSSASFMAVALPANVLSVVSVPANGSIVGQVAALPFTVHAALAVDGTPGGYAWLNFSVSGGTLGLCGGTSCWGYTDANGNVSSTVTPGGVGSVGLTAATQGGQVISTSFTSALADHLSLVSMPANGSYAGVAAAVPFAVKVLLANGSWAPGVSVTLTASGGTLGACGLSSCVVTADFAGSVSTTVTPSGAGTVGLTAAAGGGTVSGSFTAVALPADVLRITSLPANGSYAGVAATVPFAISVTQWNGAGAGASVTLTATNGSLGACGLSSCVVTADATGAVSTNVTPSAAGLVGLSASAGGGTVSGSFSAVALPPDTLRVVSVPANGSYAGVVAAIPFAVLVNKWDGSVAAGSPVTLTASGGTLGGCGLATCVVTADATGSVSSLVTPSGAGTVGLTAVAGGGMVSASFTAVALPVDVLRVTSLPANGSYVGMAAAVPFAVAVSAWNGVGAGAAVTLTAANGTLGACGLSNCVMTADSNGAVSATVTPSGAGTVGLTAVAGGGTVSGSFTAVAVPVDTLQIASLPAHGSYVGMVAAVPFAVKVSAWNGVAAGVSVTLTATGGSLGCGGSSCVLVADGTGTVSTTVTPALAGTVGLAAAAGGGTVAGSFMAVAVPADSLRVVSAPANGSYVGMVAAVPFAVSVSKWDGSAATGVAVTVTAAGGTLGACGVASCVLVTDATGSVGTTVTPAAVGTVGLTAAAGGGTVATSFTVVALPADGLRVTSLPANGSYVGAVAGVPFGVSVSQWNGAAAGVAVTLTASGGTLGVCGLASCVVTADSSGAVSSTVTPSGVGSVGLTAAAGGGRVSASFLAVAAPVDVLRVVSAPANGSFVGSVTGAPFAVRVLLGDGVTAAAGAAVTLTVSGGALGCGGGSCVLVADGTGLVSTAVTPLAAGSVVLGAAAGGGVASASFTAANHVRTVTVAQAMEYVAAGARVAWSPEVTVVQDGVAMAGVTVAWTAGAGMTVGAGSSVTDGSGNAAIAGVVGPMGVGQGSAGTACAWGTVCASFGAVVVDAAQWQVVIVSGAGQTVTLGGVLQPLVVQVVDGAGHGVAGAAVQVEQVANGWVVCPATGRCPVGPGLGSVSGALVSDVHGLVTIVPLVVGGTAEVTQVAVVAGTSGFATAEESVAP
jgi:hypothetical protein